VAINQPEFTSSFSKSREIEPGESYTLTVTFRPAVTGQNNATLDILIDNQSTAAVTVDLSGAGMSDSSNPVAAASPVYRFYNAASGSHFYTISAGERDWIGQNLHVMHDEGVAYYAFTTNEPGTSPVHRFYNTVSGSHFYTVSAGEKDWIAQNLPELHYEGIAYYAQPPASQ
jgi:glycogen debranching enzyme